MANFGHGTRGHLRPRGRPRSRWEFPSAGRSRVRAAGPDRTTLGIVGVVCAIAGFFALGIVLGPVAVVCGRLALGRGRSSTRPVTALVALVLGAIDTLLALLWLTGTTGGPGNGLL